MKLFTAIILVLLAVLSIAAGIPKLLEMPQEVDLLHNIGFGGLLVPFLGVVQVIGGVLFVWPKARMVGSTLVFAGFAISCLAVFISGNVAFALLSVVPPVLTVVVTVRVSRG